MQAIATTSTTARSVVTVAHRSTSIRLEAAAATRRVSSERVGESVSRGCPAFRKVQVVALPHMGEPSFTRGAYSGHRPAFLDDVNPWSAL